MVWDGVSLGTQTKLKADKHMNDILLEYVLPTKDLNLDPIKHVWYMLGGVSDPRRMILDIQGASRLVD